MTLQQVTDAFRKVRLLRIQQTFQKEIDYVRVFVDLLKRL